MVLDAALAAARHDQDVRESGARRLLHHELDGRRIHDGQHLLGLSLRGRQEPRAEPRRRDHRFAYLHRAGTIAARGNRRPFAGAAGAREGLRILPWSCPPTSTGVAPAVTASTSCSRSRTSRSRSVRRAVASSARSMERRRSRSRAPGSTPPTAAGRPDRRASTIPGRTRSSPTARRLTRKAPGVQGVQGVQGQEGLEGLEGGRIVGLRRRRWRLGLVGAGQERPLGPELEAGERGVGRIVTSAEIGVFGGSGFYSFLERTETVNVETPYGPPERAARDR